VTATSFEAAIERLHRVTFWTRGYRALMAHGVSGQIRVDPAPEAEMPGGHYAWLDVEDVAWLLKVARTAQAAAEEQEDMLGHRLTDADYPATARLVDLFKDGDAT
jgi:hypothetical protein